MMEGGEAVASNCQTVMDREHDADDATREVLIAVRRTFITPFDRGSIRDLITAMDNSIDQMQKTAKTVALFDVKAFTPKMKEMGDAIVKSAELVQEAVPCSDPDKEATRLSALTEQISQLEDGRTNCMMRACAHFTGITRNRIRWRSLSAMKSMTIWKRSLTDLMTSPTFCTASSSSTCNYFRAERRWTLPRCRFLLAWSLSRWRLTSSTE
jgi:hypothetical protein